MNGDRNYILQLTDSLTGKRAALRLVAEDAGGALGGLLDKYLRFAPVEQLLEEGRVTGDSAEALQDVQDLVYASSDDGALHDMFYGVVFEQAGAVVELRDVPSSRPARVGDADVAVVDVAINRLNVDADRNWVGFHRRRWARHRQVWEGFVWQTLTEKYSEAEAHEILRLDTQSTRLKFLKNISKKIWESQFENFSRFTGRKLAYKTGDEALRNIIEGRGGICSEKVQGLKFITDHYGFQSEYVLAGADTPLPVPEDRLRELLTTFDFRFAKRYMRYWQHVALLYTLDDSQILVDVTNGNIPFLFVSGDDAEAILGYEDKRPVTVRMAVKDEDFYYHRVSQDIPQRLYFAMEGWLEDVDLVQVFENELGFFISPEFFVTPVVFRSAEAFEDLKRQYVQVCEDEGLACSVSDEWALDSPLAQEFARQSPEVAEQILQSQEHLLERYDKCHGSGHKAGLVVIGLRGDDEKVRNAI